MPDFWFSPKAEQDLESIWAYSFEQSGQENANQYTGSLFSVFLI